MVAAILLRHRRPLRVIGGSVSGLSGSGLVLVNGTDRLAVTANGSFAFGAAMESGAAYDVRVLKNPSEPVQRCAVENGHGTVAAAAVTSLSVACVTQAARFAYSMSTATGRIRSYNVEVQLVGGACVVMESSDREPWISQPTPVDGSSTCSTPVLRNHYRRSSRA